MFLKLGNREIGKSIGNVHIFALKIIILILRNRVEEKKFFFQKSPLILNTQSLKKIKIFKFW